MFEKLIAEKRLGDVNCLVWKNGQIVYKESHGYKNLETHELMPMNAIFRISSMTKPITSVLAMKLFEENKLSLDDPITKWFPQFGDMKVLNKQSHELGAAIRDITILDLLTHRAGFTYGGFQDSKLENDYLLALGGDIDTSLSNKEWLNNLSNLSLLNQPGELFNYRRSTDLLGILIPKIEEKSLGKVMEEKIFHPLAMDDTFFSVPSDKKYRCAANFCYDVSGNLITLDSVPLNMAFKERPDNLEFESGGQGLWSTVDDYLKFSRIFVENGKSDNIQILKPVTIDKWRLEAPEISKEVWLHKSSYGNFFYLNYYFFITSLISQKEWIAVADERLVRDARTIKYSSCPYS